SSHLHSFPTRRSSDLLDPDVIRIARDPTLFNFVSECRPNISIVQGDARLTIGNAPDASYDLIFVDAFIGAAIPIHLLTREAMARSEEHTSELQSRFDL